MAAQCQQTILSVISIKMRTCSCFTIQYNYRSPFGLQHACENCLTSFKIAAIMMKDTNHNFFFFFFIFVFTNEKLWKQSRGWKWIYCAAFPLSDIFYRCLPSPYLLRTPSFSSWLSEEGQRDLARGTSRRCGSQCRRTWKMRGWIVKNLRDPQKLHKLLLVSHSKHFYNRLCYFMWLHYLLKNIWNI